MLLRIGRRLDLLCVTRWREHLPLYIYPKMGNDCSQAPRADAPELSSLMIDSIDTLSRRSSKNLERFTFEFHGTGPQRVRQQTFTNDCLPKCSFQR